MTLLPVTTTQPAKIDWRATAIRVGGLLFVIGISAAILASWEQVERLGAYGYPAVFIVSLLSSATLLLPAPGLAIVTTMGAVHDPVLIGLIAGLGAALGEMTAYVAGYCGTNIVEDQPFYRRFEGWMRKAGGLVIFVLAVVPNPVFDAGGLIAGAIRMPAWRFLLIAWLGKSLRFGLFAGLGAVAL
jgi:membrane protein YqaA with SNARE-associated domain